MVKRKFAYWGAGLALICVFAAAAFFNGLTVTRYSLVTDKINEPVRIVFLSDLHSCYYGENQEELTAKIEGERPDVIVMSGDIADDEMPHEGTVELLEWISARYDCYYVTGNHEFWSGEVDAIKRMFRKYKVHVLEGDCEAVQINQQVINICGVDDPEAGEKIFDEQLADAFRFADPNLYTILLSHRPERFERYAVYDCDLALAGHAHGGQWRDPFGIGGLIAPDQGFFPKYTSGLYIMNGTQMLVSRGLSRESTRLPRIFNPPELVVIDIGPK